MAGGSSIGPRARVRGHKVQEGPEPINQDAILGATGWPKLTQARRLSTTNMAPKHNAHGAPCSRARSKYTVDKVHLHDGDDTHAPCALYHAAHGRGARALHIAHVHRVNIWQPCTVEVVSSSGRKILKIQKNLLAGRYKNRKILEAGTVWLEVIEITNCWFELIKIGKPW